MPSRFQSAAADMTLMEKFSAFVVKAGIKQSKKDHSAAGAAKDELHAKRVTLVATKLRQARNSVGSLDEHRVIYDQAKNKENDNRQKGKSSIDLCERPNWLEQSSLEETNSSNQQRKSSLQKNEDPKEIQEEACEQKEIQELGTQISNAQRSVKERNEESVRGRSKLEQKQQAMRGVMVPGTSNKVKIRGPLVPRFAWEEILRTALDEVLKKEKRDAGFDQQKYVPRGECEDELLLARKFPNEHNELRQLKQNLSLNPKRKPEKLQQRNAGSKFKVSGNDDAEQRMNETRATMLKQKGFDWRMKMKENEEKIHDPRSKVFPNPLFEEGEGSSPLWPRRRSDVGSTTSRNEDFNLQKQENLIISRHYGIGNQVQPRAASNVRRSVGFGGISVKSDHNYNKRPEFCRNPEKRNINRSESSTISESQNSQQASTSESEIQRRNSFASEKPVFDEIHHQQHSVECRSRTRNLGVESSIMVRILGQDEEEDQVDAAAAATDEEVSSSSSSEFNLGFAVEGKLRFMQAGPTKRNKKNSGREVHVVHDEMPHHMKERAVVCSRISINTQKPNVSYRTTAKAIKEEFERENGGC